MMTEDRQKAIFDLVEYCKLNFPCGSSGNSAGCMRIKPKGAFTESPSFYAVIQKHSNSNYELKVFVDDLYLNRETGFEHMILHRNLDSDISKAIHLAITYLDTMVFDKYSGEFTSKEYRDAHAHLSNYQSIMNRLWNLDNEITCCVCHEETATQTICNHRLCIICWAEINRNAQKEHRIPRCPMCRSNIRYYQSESDVEEEEEEEED